jgi:hypothetical protein
MASWDDGAGDHLDQRQDGDHQPDGCCGTSPKESKGTSGGLPGNGSRPPKWYFYMAPIVRRRNNINEGKDMKTKLFSAFAASELLGRDRQTLVRCLRNVPPDGKEKNQPRWKMSTIFTAMERHNRANEGNGGSNNYTNANSSNAPNPPEYSQFDTAFAALEALSTLPARRKAAIAIMPKLHAMIAALVVQGRDGDEHPQHTQLRGERVYQLMMAGFQSPCQWSHDQVWQNLNSVGFDEDGEPIQ